MPPQRVYISDTNIWIDFGHAGLLDAVFALPFTFVSTDFVMGELNHPAPAGLLARGLVVESLDEAAVAQLFGLMDQHNNSSLADVSCYLVAKTQGKPLLTGDGRLRKQAAKDGLEVRGALWLLDQLVEHGTLPQPMPLPRCRPCWTRGRGCHSPLARTDWRCGWPEPAACQIASGAVCNRAKPGSSSDAGERRSSAARGRLIRSSAKAR